MPLVLLLVTSHAVLAAGPLPEGGRFVSGSGTIATQGNTLTITQTSPRAIMDWRSFSIGNGNTVNVTNGGAFNSTLARVSGNERSVIDGTLTASTHFYLINPHGVLIGKTGVISSGGNFVASTLDTDNDVFLSGAGPLFKGSSNAAVVNLGKISSSGGSVFLISRTLAENDGTISAPQGVVELSVGDSVQLRQQFAILSDPTATPQTYVSATGGHGDAVNKGTIDAARIALQAADGNVFALAGKSTALRATGVTGFDGRVWLVAARGTAHVHGDVEAHDVQGTGGTVETQGAALHLDDANVLAGQWNVSAPQLDVGPKTAAVLLHNLNNGTSIDIDATSRDLHLRWNLSWSGDADLTVGAARSVFVEPGVTLASRGAGSLTLRADSGGTGGAGGAGGVTNRGTLDWSRSTGNITVLRDGSGAYAPGTILLNPGWSAPQYSGLKTQLTAYKLVNTVADLQNISNDMAGNYALGHDLGSQSAFTYVDPIGGALRTAFTGQFDGQNHVLSLFSINGYTVDPKARDVYTGLFSEIGAGGVVRNLGLYGASTETVTSAAGLLAGRNAGTISHVYADGGSVVTDDPFFAVGAGGLVGINEGVIERSWSSATVRGSGPIGGIAGINDGTLVQSYSKGFVYGAASTQAGGLVGLNRGTVDQSYSTSYVRARNAGGLVAINEGRIAQSYSDYNTDAANSPLAGGVASVNRGSISNDVYWTLSPFILPIPGVFSGTQMPAANGRTPDQMHVATNYASSWNFGPGGAWFLAPGGLSSPILRWQLGE